MSVTALQSALARGQPTVGFGLSRAACALVAARLADDQRPLIVVAPSEEDVQRLSADVCEYLGLLRGNAPTPRVLPIPENDISPYAELTPDRSRLRSRMAALFQLARGDAPMIVVLSARSLLRRVMRKDDLLELSTTLALEQQIDRDAWAAKWMRAGYKRVGLVEQPGDFAIRGGVIDIFSPLYSDPIRIELFGDEIETIRSFDVDTQRTLRELSRALVPPVRETVASPGADIRGRIFAAADEAAHPSRAGGGGIGTQASGASSRGRRIRRVDVGCARRANRGIL